MTTCARGWALFGVLIADVYLELGRGCNVYFEPPVLQAATFTSDERMICVHMYTPHLTMYSYWKHSLGS